MARAGMTPAAEGELEGEMQAAGRAEAPSMASVAGEASAAACKAVEKMGFGFSSNDGRATVALALAGRLLQWDAARMALEAARLRGKAGRA